MPQLTSPFSLPPGEERLGTPGSGAEAQAPAGNRPVDRAAAAGDTPARSSRRSAGVWRCCACAPPGRGATQLAKLTFRKPDAPFTLTWFATVTGTFGSSLLQHRKSAEKQSVKQRYRHLPWDAGSAGAVLRDADAAGWVMRWASRHRREKSPCHSLS